MAALKYTPFKTEETFINISGKVSYITFKAYEAYPELLCVMSTREGGISTGQFSSMNLGRAELDGIENVKENFRLFAAAIKTDPGDIVISDQKHTDNIKIVHAEDRGKGLFKDKDYDSIDGFITNEKNIALCLLFADCVPVYLYDPVNKAIGLVHSGWKGTALNISDKAVRMMNENFTSRPEDIVAVIGPSICKSCYEVSSDLYEAFSKKFSSDELSAIFEVKKDDKFLLDLWLANKIILKKAGLCEENIHTTDLCTSCNKDFLFSHRASDGKRGNLAALIELKQSSRC